jgi:hypothetical protein
MSWFLIALLVAIAALAGYGLGRHPARASNGTTPLSADAEHVLDLLRRAHGAVVGVAVEERGPTLVAADVHRAVSTRWIGPWRWRWRWQMIFSPAGRPPVAVAAGVRGCRRRPCFWPRGRRGG